MHLPAKEQALARLLVERFNDVVSAADLIRSAWPRGITAPNVLACRVSTMRTRIASLGLEILGSSSKGYILQPRPFVLGEPPKGFE